MRDVTQCQVLLHNLGLFKFFDNIIGISTLTDILCESISNSMVVLHCQLTTVSIEKIKVIHLHCFKLLNPLITYDFITSARICSSYITILFEYF